MFALLGCLLWQATCTYIHSYLYVLIRMFLIVGCYPTDFNRVELVAKTTQISSKRLGLMVQSYFKAAN